ncbi:outer membrane protein assembly factor BamA [Arenimonas caeni]|uniref:Outer membrane protein assembly factor BamA n=2 Tax=Arenimonas caeni TaxID=2058085 RepID=A0A2P6MA39_9GAMM|nr:outer membrane protein assembly factor BamA [Arenimonas caeni]MDY0021501.1 outer membrane protein assembly factor BamA [Arenimonas caeni]PRH82843.1 outer membrane protein assembly factor BamA [Arenimonas caeni]
MTRPNVRRCLLSIALAAALAGPAHAQNYEAFQVADIRVEGLQRISAGTVFTYLPVERGDLLDRSRSGDAIRALFRTGFFSDVRLERQGDILVVVVTERPAINSITLTGNKDVKTEDLLVGLRSIGLAEGETFNPLNLDRVTQELTRQYNNRGKYNVSITPSIRDLDRNRVDITIVVAEGKAARIRDINIVGNETYLDEDLRKTWESDTSNWLSWYRRDDQYSREKLSGDLEKLNNYYLDRGYVDFNVESTQVAISPDKRDIFVTANVAEGEVYTVGTVKVTGDTVLPVEEMEKLVFLAEGSTFSRARVEMTTDAMIATLGNIGFAFAQVNAIPDIDRENRVVGLNFFVEPGPRVQVRRIVFKGNTGTADEVLRREMRQFEGAWFSQAAIDRSKIRLQRLGFFETVDIETPEVAGAPDQVDVVVNVKERNSGQFTFGLGYQQTYGLITSLQLVQNNFLGTGNRVAVAVQNNTFSKQYTFGFTDPYFTDSGVSVGYNLAYSDFNYSRRDANLAQYNNEVASGEVLVGLPLTETDSVQFSLGIDRNGITTQDGFTPEPLIQYLVATMGDRQRGPAFHFDDDNDPETPIDNDDNDPSTTDPLNYGLSRRWNINAWRLQAGWVRDSRNDFLMPTRGTYHRINGEFVLPGSDLEYYRIGYNFEHYMPLTSWMVLKIGAELGYGDAYGDTAKATCPTFDNEGDIIIASNDCGLPFFRNYYAGGPSSVRGFEVNTVGPSYQFTGDGFRQPLGGSLKTAGTFEFFFPGLFESRGTRLSAFIDYGNVYLGFDDWEAKTLRISTGLALQWQSPMGPIQISYALPLQRERSDQIERLQFTFGGSF